MIEWWTARTYDRGLIVLHTLEKGRINHDFFCLDDTEFCPTCGKAVPAYIILGSKIGAL